MEELNGKSIDFSEKGKKDTEIETSSKRRYVLRKDHTSVHSIVRPVIRNDLDGSTGVGPAFAGTFNLAEKIDIKQVSSSEALPVRLLLNVLWSYYISLTMNAFYYADIRFGQHMSPWNK